MTALKSTDFGEFFHAIHQREPFPWQTRLVKRVCGNVDAPGQWPRCIALPTAAGKTACIDIAVFALACQAALPAERRTAPRRIFFVVDRRIVVDQAYEHAREVLAKQLCKPETEILRRVADALRQVGAHNDRPLDVYALRGGMYREPAWVRSPVQPTVITSTVDQVGSRLLFRGYGVSDASKPLHAALMGNDALILLDEAHCAGPFEQTMTLVKKYRGWVEAEHCLPLPFHFVAMTATPSGDPPEDQVERLTSEDREHPVLGKRIRASKPTKLVVASGSKGNQWREELVKELVKQARSLQTDEFRAVGVIVNRVATAREVAATLRQAPGDAADVILLTGRMRPVDKDLNTEKLAPLFSNVSGELTKRIFVVATQTLEVGADLDFHALVSECASLDALRQRFGRLNRVAARETTAGVVVVRADQAPSSDDDPVYGSSLSHTWQWLNEHAHDEPILKFSEVAQALSGKKKSKHAAKKGSATAVSDKILDFGVAALEKLIEGVSRDDLAKLNAPTMDAAVLLPAHLDAWCQTSPRPTPDPDPSYFLHGPQRGEPEVQVVFRADLGENESRWAEIVSVCPPSSSEALSVRLRDFRCWLKGQRTDGTTSDVEGERVEDSDGTGDSGDFTSTPLRALRWRGPDSCETSVVEASERVTPTDVYVVPISTSGQRAAAAQLGDFPVGDDGLPMVTDAGDAAFQRSRDHAFLRLRHDIYPMLDASYAGLVAEQLDGDESDAKIEGALNVLRDHPDESVRRAVEQMYSKRRRMTKGHPLGGLVLIGKCRLHRFDPTFVEPEDSWEAASDQPYPLDQHCREVATRADHWAERCGLNVLAQPIKLAGRLHDAGKADPRFQAWLHGGNRRRAESLARPLAKSYGRSLSRMERRNAREQAGFPQGGRHELASVRLAECAGALPFECNAAARDLVLHLIASHHGYCRPFAPVVEDSCREAFSFDHEGRPLLFNPDYSTASGHGLEHLDSGVAERFWKLTRRHGWWGLPYIEALLRLADWACSEPVESVANTCEHAVERAPSYALVAADSAVAHAETARMNLPTPESSSLVLSGLDGSNPLAFLAALGALRALTRAWPDSAVRMSWRLADGAWRPALHVALESRDVVSALLEKCREAAKHPTLAIADNLTIKPENLRSHTMSLLGSDDRDATAFAAAFGSDAITTKTGNIADTALRTMSGAGHQHFLKSMRDVLASVNTEHIERALFHAWDYADPLRGLSLRFDPMDDKRYALQWIDPGTDSTRGSRGNMLGANALAVLGIPLLAVAPVRAELLTTCFQGSRSTDCFLTWPVWKWPLSLDVAASLLSQEDIQLKSPPRGTLSNQGVVEVYRSQRITTDKFRNFTPSTSV